MTRRSLGIALIVAVVVAALALIGQNGPAVRVADETIHVGDVKRNYRLVVPEPWPEGEVAVLFAFHGIGDSPASMAQYTGLDRLAARHQFLLVYPAARNTMWATEQLTDLDSNPDLLFFAELLAHMRSRFDIDEERIFVAGMSNGAEFAQAVANVQTDVDAVVAHSGARPSELARPSHRFPILMLVGADDEFTAAAVRESAENYRKWEHKSQSVVIQGLGHEWSKRHNEEIWRFLNDRNGRWEW